MLDNIKKTSVEAQKKLYASPGDMVIDKYRSDRSDEENIREMLAEINRLGPSKISKHCAAPHWHSCISPWQYNHVIQRS